MIRDKEGERSHGQIVVNLKERLRPQKYVNDVESYSVAEMGSTQSNITSLNINTSHRAPCLSIYL